MTPFRSTSSRWILIALLHLAALLGATAWVWWQTRPVAMPDLHLAAGERLKCVSYAPYRFPGQTPFALDLHVDRRQIVDDLTALSRITECVRLYSVDQGLDQVPEVARELGLKVLLGAWIGYDVRKNAIQLDRAIALANAYPDVVRALIVGNEVLLRHERTEDELRALIQYAKARVHVPVTYADVWEFWLKHPKLADSVDWVTIHILPFWEDQPVAIERAIAHVDDVYAEVARRFHKPLLIGESGWPSAGRQREVSVPSLVNQARYVREFIRHAEDKGWNYNLIEAIDQPWKRRLEGTVGGYWGILNVDLTPKFPLAGPVAERAAAWPPLAAAAVGALVCLILSGAAGGAARGIAAAAAGGFAGMVMELQAEHALLAYRNIQEWLVLGTVWLLAGLVPLALARWRGDALPAADEAWAALRARGRAAIDAAAVLGLLRGALLFAAAVAALLLAVDPRYRDFPTLLYAVPALAFLVPQARSGAEERVCALVLGVTVVVRWSMEPANPQAIGWLLAGLLLAVPAARRAAHQHQ